MTNLSTKLSKVQQNIEKIFELNNHLKTENQQIKTENKNLLVDLQSKQKEIKTINEVKHSIKIAKSFGDSEEKSTEAKLKINEYIREIDKCIALLNE